MALFSAAIIALSGLAQCSDEAAKQEVQQLEGELTKALLERDVSALDRLWHDDLVFIATSGARSTKRERIGMQGASRKQPGETNSNDDVDVRVFGDTAVATIVSTWTFPSSSGPVSGSYRALHVWVRDDGRWQLFAAQVAMLPR
jgi:uncharacterized protein (TIGR02246 family)